jgi:hypothetical protein
MYLTQELIAKKRDGVDLGADEIAAFVQGVTAQTVSDAQIAAFAMAVWFRGMDLGELKSLTLAMRDSGEVLRWPERWISWKASRVSAHPLPSIIFNKWCKPTELPSSGKVKNWPLQTGGSMPYAISRPRSILFR